MASWRSRCSPTSRYAKRAPISRSGSRRRPEGVARALLALLLTAALLPCAQARDVLESIDDCVAKLDSELDVSYARIAARCPDLTAALGESSFAPWLPADWKRPDNQLSAAGLSELRAQLASEGGRGEARRPPPHTEHVGAVLA